VLLAALAAACSPPSDEEIIRERLAAMAAAARDKNVLGVRRYLAPRFTARHGRLAVDVNRLLLAWFHRHEVVEARVFNVQVEVEGDGARVRFQAVAGGGPGLLPERLELFDVDSRWRRDPRDGWLMTAAAGWRLELDTEALPAPLLKLLERAAV